MDLMDSEPTQENQDSQDTIGNTKEINSHTHIINMKDPLDNEQPSDQTEPQRPNIPVARLGGERITIQPNNEKAKIKFWVPSELDEGKVKTALSKIFRIKMEDIKIVATKKQHKDKKYNHKTAILYMAHTKLAQAEAKARSKVQIWITKGSWRSNILYLPNKDRLFGAIFIMGHDCTNEGGLVTSYIQDKLEDKMTIPPNVLIQHWKLDDATARIILWFQEERQRNTFLNQAKIHHENRTWTFGSGSSFPPQALKVTHHNEHNKRL
jgi:ribosomal protein L23